MIEVQYKYFNISTSVVMYQVVFPNDSKKNHTFSEKYHANEYIRCLTRCWSKKEKEGPNAPVIKFITIQTKMPECYKKERRFEIEMCRVATDAAKMVERLCMQHLSSMPFNVGSETRKALFDCFYTKAVKGRCLYPYYLKIADFIGYHMRNKRFSDIHLSHVVSNDIFFWDMLEETDDFTTWRTIWLADFEKIHYETLWWIFREVNNKLLEHKEWTALYPNQKYCLYANLHVKDKHKPEDKSLINWHNLDWQYVYITSSNYSIVKRVNEEVAEVTSTNGDEEERYLFPYTSSNGNLIIEYLCPVRKYLVYTPIYK